MSVYSSVRPFDKAISSLSTYRSSENTCYLPSDDILLGLHNRFVDGNAARRNRFRSCCRRRRNRFWRQLGRARPAWQLAWRPQGGQLSRNSCCCCFGLIFAVYVVVAVDWGWILSLNGGLLLLLLLTCWKPVSHVIDSVLKARRSCLWCTEVKRQGSVLRISGKLSAGPN